MNHRLPVLNQQPEPTQGCSSLLPDLSEGYLDADALDCVLADLDDFTQIREIQAKDSSGVESKTNDIVLARDEFVAGNYHGLQIIYEFAGELWCDTFLKEGEGARLLRMQNPQRVA